VTRDVTLSSVHYDADGTDETNPNGEWIVITNDGSRRIDLRDWRLLAGGKRLLFHASRTLRPGEVLTVKMGSGRNASGEVYWGLGGGVLPNLPTGGEVRLVTPYLNVKACQAWGKRSC